ncbi:hypothetical protein [Hansschlegelia sp.]|uniref:hypothetical protein n=1 Tax=Hansschlegelia sp. TaxID=2041892 RepID=UPI002CEF8E95|nr:hypothetical protein [Hansschlegelia sp.]HVI30424.1 hypothetical protein [Hansschlegelia sp.]
MNDDRRDRLQNALAKSTLRLELRIQDLEAEVSRLRARFVDYERYRSVHNATTVGMIVLVIAF